MTVGGTAPRRRRTRLLAVPFLVLLLAAGCRSDDDPRAELERAVAATAAEPFTFALSARADRAALDQLGGDAVAAASFLEDAGLTGAREPDGRLQVALTLGGDVPLLEAISQGGDGLLLRTGLGELLGLEGQDPAEQLAPALDELGVSPAGREALATSFAGGWVELTDVADLGELLGATTPGDEEEVPDGAGDLLDEVAVTGARDAGEVRRLDVEVAVSALLGPLGLGGADRSVPGTVDLRDGRVLEVRLELSGGDLAAPDGAEDDAADVAGVVELVLSIAPTSGDGPVVERPEPGAALTAAELLTLVGQLQGTAGDAAP